MCINGSSVDDKTESTALLQLMKRVMQDILSPGTEVRSSWEHPYHIGTCIGRRKPALSLCGVRD